jgi:hypothetical protein
MAPGQQQASKSNSSTQAARHAVTPMTKQVHMGVTACLAAWVLLLLLQVVRGCSMAPGQPYASAHVVRRQGSIMHDARLRGCSKAVTNVAVLARLYDTTFVTFAWPPQQHPGCCSVDRPTT